MSLLGNLKTICYRNPRDELRRFISWGPMGYLFTDRWSKEMETHAYTLPEITEKEQQVELWFLTGERFWHQTAFCAWTFATHSGVSVSLKILDDGSLEERHIQCLSRIFGDVQVFLKTELDRKISLELPKNRFPILNQQCSDYINIRKLIDPHLSSSGPKLVLDSDMLFFAKPNTILEWLNHPESVLHMTDCMESYGYSRNLLEEIAENPIPYRLNVGICGLKSEWLNWEKVESWCDRLITAGGSNYYLEQALIAILAGGQATTCCPEKLFVTLPSPEESQSPTAILHHYVAESKPAYFRWGWKSALRMIPDSL